MLDVTRNSSSSNRSLQCGPGAPWQLSVPPPSVPLSPHLSGNDGSYPEDQEHEEDEVFVDSSLSVHEVIAQVVDRKPGKLVDFSGGGGEGIDGSGCENSCGSRGDLEPFDPLSVGTHMLLAHRVTFSTVLHRKFLLVFNSPKNFVTVSQG